MAKTKKQRVVDAFVKKIDPKRREDCLSLIHLMTEASGEDPVPFSEVAVGFGNYHYKYESGREGDSVLVSFAMRKQNIAVYIMPGFSKYKKQLSKLGKHKAGSSCLTINKLADVDLDVLEEIVRLSVEQMRAKYH